MTDREATMPFGKHRGKALNKLPRSYLCWLRALDLREPLRSAVERECRKRFRHARRERTERPAVLLALSPPVRQAAEDIVAAGFRRLAAEHHPDHGGSHAEMVALNAAASALRHVLRRGAP